MAAVEESLKKRKQSRRIAAAVENVSGVKSSHDEYDDDNGDDVDVILVMTKGMDTNGQLDFKDGYSE